MLSKGIGKKYHFFSFYGFSYLQLQSVTGCKNVIVVCILQFYDMRIRNRAFFSFTRIPKSWGSSVKVSEIRHECLREGGGGSSRKCRRISSVFTIVVLKLSFFMG